MFISHTGSTNSVYRSKNELIVGRIFDFRLIIYFLLLAYLFQSGIYKEYNMLSKGQFQLNQHIFSISVQSVTPLQNNPPNLLIPYNTLFFYDTNFHFRNKGRCLDLTATSYRRFGDFFFIYM